MSAAEKKKPVFVVVQLSGGNDFMNMLVPYGNPLYYDFRKTVDVAEEENAEVHTERIKRHLPPDGEVRVITITDKQFERMSVLWGKMRKPPERAPCQLELF